jgi:hypothetical protein
MEDITNIKAIWAKQEEKLERNWKLNLEVLKKVNIASAGLKMKSLIWLNSITLAFYQMTTWYFVYFTVAHWTKQHYAVAGLLLALWSAMISYGAMKQLQLILKIDYAGAVADVQKNLQLVKVSILHYLRLGLMVIPLNMAFIVLFFELIFSIDIMEVADQNWLIWQAIFSAATIIPSIWIYKKLSPKNMNKKWINWLLQGYGSQVNDAIEFIGEIDNFEKDKN